MVIFAVFFIFTSSFFARLLYLCNLLSAVFNVFYREVKRNVCGPEVKIRFRTASRVVNYTFLDSSVAMTELYVLSAVKILFAKP